MARKVITELVDDINGSEATGTVRFDYLGTGYEIDLSAKNEKALRKVLGRYIDKARKAGSNGRVRGRHARTPKANSQAIREWAKSHGHPDISPFGRIPQSIIDEYNKAN